MLEVTEFNLLCLCYLTLGQPPTTSERKNQKKKKSKILGNIMTPWLTSWTNHNTNYVVFSTPA